MAGAAAAFVAVFNKLRPGFVLICVQIKMCLHILHTINVKYKSLCNQILVIFEKTGVIDMKMNWFVAKCSANTQTAR